MYAFDMLYSYVLINVYKDTYYFKRIPVFKFCVSLKKSQQITRKRIEIMFKRFTVR